MGTAPDCEAPLTAPADFIFRSLWQAKTCDRSPSDKMEEDSSAVESVDKPFETEIWARRVLYKDASLLYFCDAKNPSDGNWVASSYGDSDAFSASNWNSRTWAKQFKDPSFWHHHVRRYVYFDAAPYGFPGPHYLALFPGFVFNYNLNRYSPTEGWDWQKIVRFQTPSDIPDTSAPFRTQKSQLLSLLEDKGSKAYFALQWRHATYEQQRAQVMHLQRGDIADMQRLLRAALTIQTDLWKQHASLRWETRDWLEEPLLKRPEKDHLWEQGTFPPTDVYDIPHRLNYWKKLIWSYFRPTLHPDVFKLAKKTMAAYVDLTTISVEVASRTERERIESLLMLRPWWQQNFAPLLFSDFSNQPEFK